MRWYSIVEPVHITNNDMTASDRSKKIAEHNREGRTTVKAGCRGLMPLQL